MIISVYSPEEDQSCHHRRCEVGVPRFDPKAQCKEPVSFVLSVGTRRGYSYTSGYCAAHGRTALESAVFELKREASLLCKGASK